MDHNPVQGHTGAVSSPEHLLKRIQRSRQIGFVSAFGLVVHIDQLAESFADCPCQFSRTVGRHQCVLATQGDGDRHRKTFREIHRATLAILLGDLFLRATEGHRNRILELVIGHMVGQWIQGNNAGNQLWMQCRERQSRGAAHRTATDEYAPDLVLLPQQFDQLKHVGFGGRSHPRRLGTVVGRNDQHSAPLARNPGSTALAAVITNVLPTVGTMAMKRKKQINRLVGINGLGTQHDVPLLAAVILGDKRAIQLVVGKAIDSIVIGWTGQEISRSERCRRNPKVIQVAAIIYRLVVPGADVQDIVPKRSLNRVGILALRLSDSVHIEDKLVVSLGFFVANDCYMVPESCEYGSVRRTVDVPSRRLQVSEHGTLGAPIVQRDAEGSCGFPPSHAWGLFDHHHGTAAIICLADEKLHRKAIVLAHFEFRQRIQGLAPRKSGVVSLERGSRSCQRSTIAAGINQGIRTVKLPVAYRLTQGACAKYPRKQQYRKYRSPGHVHWNTPLLCTYTEKSQQQTH